MRKTGFSMLLVLLLLAGLVVATGAAGQEPEEVIITVWFDGSHTVAEGDTIVIRAGWLACTPGLVKAFIVACNWTVTLDGATLLTPDDVDPLWGPIQLGEDPLGYCLGQGRPAFASWRYVLPELEPGEHNLLTSMRLDHLVIDTGDYDGDGKPDQYTPEGYTFDTVNTITVLEE